MFANNQLFCRYINNIVRLFNFQYILNIVTQLNVEKYFSDNSTYKKGSAIFSRTFHCEHQLIINKNRFIPLFADSKTPTD